MQLPTLTNLMFLDPSIESYVAHVREEHAPCFQFAMRLNELAHRSLFDCTVDSDDVQQILLSTLLPRALTSYQATILLGERGMPQEAQVMLRTLIEVTFKIVAIAKDRTVATAFIQEDTLHRKKFLKKYKSLNPELDKATVETLQDLQEQIAQQIKEADIKELKTQWFAQQAGLLDFYNSAYAVLSDSVHANVRTLELALNIDDSDKLIGLNYGFSDEGLDMHLLTAIESLILSLRAVFSIVDVSNAEEIHSIHGEFNALHASIVGSF